MKIYVAGPVVPSRYGPYDLGPVSEFYRGLQQAAKRANIDLFLPLREPDLDQASPRAFTQAIRRRLQESDAVIAVVGPPIGPRDWSGYSIGAEGQIGTDLGRPVVVVAQDPAAVPRLVTSWTRGEVYELGKVDIPALLRDLRGRGEPPLSPGTGY